MIRGKKTFLIPLVLLGLVFWGTPFKADAQTQHQHHAKADTAAGTGHAAAFADMPAPGKKVPIGNDGYLIYRFDKKPKMGTVIMKVELYSPDGKKETFLEVLGDSGMPSMRGAHETGDQPFKLSKKGDYLLPVDIVMPGDWEVRLTIKKDGQVIFRGSHKFDV
jgi:hypothetical protein